MTFMLLAAAFLNLGQVSKPADDFAFRLEYGSCTTDVLDTFQRAFVRDLGSRVPGVSIPLMLPQESLDVAYQSITSAHFFDYPSDFQTRPATNCSVTLTASGSTISCPGISGFAPANHYRLEVRDAGARHVVSWRDGIAPSTEEANRLRTMFATIIDIIRRLPQVQRLPVAQVGCG
jgi:hypothetical protein